MIPMGRKSNLALGNTPACPVTQSENLDQFLMIHLSKWKAIGNFSHQWPVLILRAVAVLGEYRSGDASRVCRTIYLNGCRVQFTRWAGNLAGVAHERWSDPPVLDRPPRSPCSAPLLDDAFSL